MSTATSNQRHLIAVVILIGIYCLPLAIDYLMIDFSPLLIDILQSSWIGRIILELYNYWLRHILISCLCISLIVRYTTLQEKITYCLFALELICIYTCILASKSQWFNSQFDFIMTVIFYTEIIIVIGSAGGGAIYRNYKHSSPLRKLLFNVYNRAKGNVLGL